MSNGYVEPTAKTARPEADSAIAPPPIRPFPYFPTPIPLEQMKRETVMNELNMWANNDPFMAKRSAETLIMLLASQFDINLLKINE